MRVRAAEFSGRSWLNTGGRPLTLSGLRGKFVLLDFWTFACVNCLHVIEELRPLQERFDDVLVTIGVHSPKFAHEGTPQAVIDAVDRYRVQHPVLDDPDLVTWDAYAAKAWPTLVLIDPQGYVIEQVAGEKHTPRLAALIEEQIAVHQSRGTLHRGDGPYRPPPASSIATEDDVSLRFPGGLLVLPPDRIAGGGLLISDTAHQQLVIQPVGDADAGGGIRIGSGERGTADGGPEVARFADPLGAALLPPAVAAQVGYDVVIADSGSDALRGLTLADLSVRTLAGPDQGLSTPWDVAWFDGALVIAMAGVHQLWSFDPVTAGLRVLAGTGREGLVDGSAARSWFAQPSGLATGEQGRVLWVVDAETSALRLLWFAGDDRPGDLQVRTAVGQGLFESGLVDGDAGPARLQHPLGVAVLLDGSVAIADTYNGAVRRYDPATDQVSTLATGLAEPSALVLDVINSGPGSGRAPARLVVAEAAGHRLERVPIGAHAADPHRGPRRTRHPVVDLSPGSIEVSIDFEPPAGQKLDERDGPPTRLDVTAAPTGLLVSGAGHAPGLTRALVLDAAMPGGISGGRVEGVLVVAAQVVTCDLGDDIGAACHFLGQDWEVPFRLVPGAPRQLCLAFTPVS